MKTLAGFFSQLIEEPSISFLPPLIAGKSKEFIGRVLKLVLQAKTKDDGVSSKELEKQSIGRDGSTRANSVGFLAVKILQDGRGNLKTTVIRRNEVRNGAVLSPVGRYFHPPRGDFIHVANEEIGNLGRVLIGHQAAGNLGMGCTGQNGFHAFTLEAAV